MAYTTIDDPSAHFHTRLYTATGNAISVTNNANAGDFQPDWIWLKSRNNATNHNAFDSSRGQTKRLYPNLTDQEDTVGTFALNSNGFSIGGSGSSGIGDINVANKTMVAWQWKANGGTTTTNDASSTGVGNTDSVYQANTTAGFSIVTWTGPSGSDARTMAHGLGGTPELIIYKNRDESVAWYVGTSATTFNFNTDYLQLNSTSAKATDAGGTVFVSAPTSTVIGASSSAASGKENIKYVAYCFRSIQGYSKIGSYTGNGNTDGPFVYTGFKPAWVMVKESSGTGQWRMRDNKRSTVNPVGVVLYANGSNAEATEDNVDFLSNGFKVRTSGAENNGNGDTYVYMAFAEHPFVSSQGVPVTAK